MTDGDVSFVALWRELDNRREQQHLSRNALAGRINRRFGPGSVPEKTLHDRMANGRRVPWDQLRKVVLALDLDQDQWKRRWRHAEDNRRRPAPPAGPRPGAPSLPVPRELPRPPGDFSGRHIELATLRALLDSAAGGPGTPRGKPTGPAIGAIDGMAGIGKSALAIQTANQVADAFPNGQLYVNLQAATPGLAPLAPLEALGRLLRALGLDPAQIPGGVEEAAARFRSLAAQRRLLLVLDNAHSAEQVRPLLPSSPTSAVLVTSRRILATLEGATRLHLDALPPGQALELLGRTAGRQRISAEPAAAAAIVRCCGYLPLAIRIAGARLAAHPTWPMRELAGRLADDTHRLQELTADDLAVRASFLSSYRALPAADAQVFRLLGLLDGPSITAGVAAALTGRPVADTAASLEHLAGAQLLETSTPDRYRFHDLLRLFAREQARDGEAEPARRAALARALEWYLASAEFADEFLKPAGLRTPAGRPAGVAFVDRQGALGWLEAERANLVAAAQQAAAHAPAPPAEVAWKLSNALWRLFDLRKHWDDWQVTCQAAIQAAQRAGNQAAAGRAFNNLGVIHGQRRRHQEAIGCLEQSLTCAGRLATATPRAGRSTTSAASTGSSSAIRRRSTASNRAGGCVTSSATASARASPSTTSAASTRSSDATSRRSAATSRTLPSAASSAIVAGRVRLWTISARSIAHKAAIGRRSAATSRPWRSAARPVTATRKPSRSGGLAV
jgi:hypothetical protein